MQAFEGAKIRRVFQMEINDVGCWKKCVKRRWEVMHNEELQ